jgi:hypothetical protein
MFGYDLIVKDSYRIVEGSFDSVIITEQWTGIKSN